MTSDKFYQPNRIWLIGGTSESVQIAKTIANLQIPCTITVTTATARKLYRETDNLRVVVGYLDEEKLEDFISNENIRAILDVSHPYALVISQLAIKIARDKHIPYLRFERPPVEQKESASGGQAQTNNQKNIINLDNFTTLLNGNYLREQSVLLTLGYKSLGLFEDWQDQATLFARVLPSTIAIETALKVGFKPNRIIAMRPPLSRDLEKALWKHWDITTVVTKASGIPGGEDIKRSIALELGINLIVIKRPIIIYPQQTSDLKRVIEWVLLQIK